MDYFDEISDATKDALDKIRERNMRFADSVMRHLKSTEERFTELGLIGNSGGVLPRVKFTYSAPPIPCSTTNTMHIDHCGKVTYNDFPDKEKAPVIYG